MEFDICEATIEDIIAISHQIPEFKNPYQLQDYQHRLNNTTFVALKAISNGEDIGFKLGYELNHNCFYSWFGGIRPEYRRFGIAKALALEQERRVHSLGYKYIRLKTRNEFKPMLIFALKLGFNIIAIEEHKEVIQHRIILEKNIE